MDEIRELEKKVNISIDKIKSIMVQKTRVPEKSAGKEFELSEHLDKLKEENQKLKKENGALLAEVNDLKSGTEAIEERARDDLGMIKKDEIFFEVIKTE